MKITSLRIRVCEPKHWQFQWRDDIRELEALPEAMRTEAAEVRALFGNGPDRSATLTRGATPAEAVV